MTLSDVVELCLAAPLWLWGAPTGGAPVGNGPVPPAFDGSLGIAGVDDRRDLFPDGGRGGLSSPADDLNHFAIDDSHGHDDGDSVPPAPAPAPAIDPQLQQLIDAHRELSSVVSRLQERVEILYGSGSSQRHAEFH